MRDDHVGQEVLAWKCIAKAWADYKGGESVMEDEAVRYITALPPISMDVIDGNRLKLPEVVATRLVECFDTAWDERWKR